MPTIRTGRAGDSRWMPRPLAWRTSSQRSRNRAASLTVQLQRQPRKSARRWLETTARRLYARQNRFSNTEDGAAWLGASYGDKNFMRPVKVRRSQDSCLHASTGKAQAYCSLSKSGFLSWHWHFENGVQGKRGQSSIGLAWFAFDFACQL